MQQAVKPKRRRSMEGLRFTPCAVFGGLPVVKRRADLPPAVDVETLEREAKAGRELMKEMQTCSN